MTLSTLDPIPALIAVDLQRGIAGRATVPHSVAAVVAHTTELAGAFRARGLPVILVRVSLDEAGFSPGRTDRPHGIAGTPPPGFDAIVDELAGHPGDVVVTKRTVGAFVGTDLDLQLRRRGVTQLMVSGIATSVGVEGTARAAHDNGYHVVVVTDAMSDTEEVAHRHSVQHVFPRIAETAETADVVAALLGHPGAAPTHAGF